MVSAIPMLLGFVICHQREPYKIFDVAEGLVQSFLLMLGSVFIGKSIQAGGKGGPI